MKITWIATLIAIASATILVTTDWQADPAPAPATPQSFTVTGPDTAQYTVQEGWRPPDGLLLWSNGGALPPSLVPYEFAGPFTLIVPCEDRAGKGADAVGDDGLALGRAQVRMDAHAARMRALGRDPMWEPDRIWFAGNVLWPESGWMPWRTCAEREGLLP